MNKKKPETILKNLFIKKTLSSIENIDSITKKEVQRFREDFLSEFHDFIKMYKGLVKDD